MAKNTKETKKQTRRTQVKDLPKGEKELSKDEQKKVQGGGGMVGLISGSRTQQT